MALDSDGTRDATAAGQQRSTPRFAGFISYNREVDTRLARTLQTALHRFAKPWYRLRALRIFRDEASLSASPGLWSSIQGALDDSEHLILLASPQAAASPWVAKEVEYWLRRKSPDRILIALTSGELAWDPVATDFDWDRTTAIPQVLRGVFAEEPRYVDLRAARDLPELSRSRVFRELVADLAAPLHHRPKDELIGEDIRLYRRSRLLASGGVVALTVLAVAATLFAVDATAQARESARQRDAATQQQRLATARGLVAQADLARATDPRTALLLGIAAQHIHSDEQTRGSLANTVTTTGYAATLPGDSAVYTLAFSPNGKVLAAGTSGKVALWDVADPVRARKLGQFDATPESMAFSADGRLLAIGGFLVAGVWDVTDPEHPNQLGQAVKLPGRGTSVGFSPDGQTLATGTSDGSTLLWDLADRGAIRQVGTPLVHSDEVRSVAFAADGHTLVSASSDQSIIVWDVTDRAKPRQLGIPLGADNTAVSPIRVAAGGRLVATKTDTRGGVALSALSGVTPARLLGPADDGDEEIRDLGFSLDGRLLVAGGVDQATVWDLEDPREPRQLGARLVGHRAGIGSVAVSTSDSRTLVATGGLTGEVNLWDLSPPVRPGESVDSPQPAPEPGERLRLIETARSQAYTADGRTLATANSAGMVSLWDVTDPARPRAMGSPLTGLNKRLVTVAVSADGRTLAEASSDGGLLLWDIHDPANPRQLGGPLPGRFGDGNVAFSPDGHLLASSARPTDEAIFSNKDGAVILYDVTDPANPRQIGSTLEQAGRAESLAFSADSHTLAAGTADNTVILWDVSDPRAPKTLGTPLTGHTNFVQNVAFSSHDRLLVTGGSDGTALLWDMADRAHPVRVGQPLSGHGTGGLVTISGDGRLLVIADRNPGNELIMWDLSDGSQPRRLGPALAAQSGAIESVGIAPDGRRLTIGGVDGTIVSWDLGPLFDLRDKAMSYACARTGRGLDRAEWARYVPGLPYEETCSL
jgi:WD40 repeat protein